MRATTLRPGLKLFAEFSLADPFPLRYSDRELPSAISAQHSAKSWLLKADGFFDDR
jgi:hypothetical protein